MTLTEAEQRFLSAQRHGQLATIAFDGTPQVKPVGFSYNKEFGTIDITGMNMARSAKYKNVRSNPHVAFVADDVPAPEDGQPASGSLRSAASPRPSRHRPASRGPAATWRRRSSGSTRGASSLSTSTRTTPDCRPATSGETSPTAPDGRNEHDGDRGAESCQYLS